jgi:2-polyprenyl-3-methyl-5-hydroxy-6-metoxy-1,4-benzoquinol methylase
MIHPINRCIKFLHKNIRTYILRISSSPIPPTKTVSHPLLIESIYPDLSPPFDPMKFETVDHCWCGGHLSYWSRDFEDYLQCDICGCKSVKSRQTEESLKHFYAEQYWYAYQKIHDCPPIQKRFKTDMKDRIPQYLNWIHQICPKPVKTLEIGCGNGRLSHELAKTGYNVSATEMDPDVAKWVRKKARIQVHTGEFPPIEASPYDLIVIIDILEHVYDPVRFVHEVKSRLGENGRIFLHCPVIDTMEEAYALKHLFHPLSHIWMHTTSSMDKLWKQAGFNLRKIGALFSMPCFVLTEKKGS